MKKVLVVDDNPQNAYMLEVLLKTNDFEVSMASNGIEALELARQEIPEMIISDILMPGMDGFKLCRACKSDEKLKEVPFIIYTATYLDPRDAKLASDLGADRYIVKPIDPNDLLKIIQDIIRDRETGGYTAHAQMYTREEVFYKEYNETLARKLESKMLDLQKANKRLTSLYKASCEMLSAKSSPDLIRIILKSIVETAGYQETDYFRYDEKHKLLILADVEGRSKLQLKDKLQFKYGDPMGLVGLVAQERKTYKINDTSKDPYWITIDETIKSALFTPVLFEDELLGVVGLFSKDINAFDEDDIQDITVLANNLAVAIINLRNTKKVQNQLARISSLHDIDMAINSSSDLQNTLDAVLMHAISQLKLDAADIFLCGESPLDFKFAAAKGYRYPEEEHDSTVSENDPLLEVAREKRIITVPRLDKLKSSTSFTRFIKMEGFVSYIGAPLIVAGSVIGVLEIFSRSNFEPDLEWLSFFETLAGQASIAINKYAILDGLRESNEELMRAYDATIAGWSRALDMRDHETEGHTQRVTEMTIQLARIMGMEEEEINQIKHGALLHDIGKLGVPDSILLKPAPLSDKEWAIMRKHPQSAYDLLQPIKYLAGALDIPYCHHEKWDGTGYPRGLKGEEIPLAARIFAVIDVYDALSSDRPYRKAWPNSMIISYIQEQSGVYFDPEIVERFLDMTGLKP